MTSRAKNRLTGFTLVELLIVVIILAILAAIVVPQFASSTEDAKISALDSTLTNMRSAVDLYYQQHGEYPGKETAVPTAACGNTAGLGAGGAGAPGVTAFLEQLSMYTDSDGGACSKKDANHKFGPYMKKNVLPENAVTGTNTLIVVDDGDLVMPGDGASGGWKFDLTTGKFIANDTNNDPSSNPYHSH